MDVKPTIQFSLSNKIWGRINVFRENQHRSKNATIIIESSGYTAQSHHWSLVGLKRCNFFLKINPVPRRDKSVLIKYWAPDGCYLFSFVPLFIRPYPISSPIYAPRYRIRSSDIQLLFLFSNHQSWNRNIWKPFPSIHSQTYSLDTSLFSFLIVEEERNHLKPLLSRPLLSLFKTFPTNYQSLFPRLSS